MSKATHWLVLGVAAVCAGCASPGSKLSAEGTQPPTLGLTEATQFSAVPAAASIASVQPTEADLYWWRRFDDPALADWVERALVANVDIAIAGERVQQARALLQSARADRGVRVGAEAGADLRLRQRESSVESQRRLQPYAALSLDFDTDLWGGLRQAERSAAANVLRGQDLAQAARLSAAGLTARAYVEWQLTSSDYRLLGNALALQQDALRIVSVRVDAGLSPVLDRDRATAEVAATQADRAAAAVRVGRAMAALQVLAGQRPQLRMPVAASLAAPAGSQAALHPLPSLDGTQPVVRPLDLLRLRPDLRAAEQALVAAAADIGVAEAAFRPRLTIPGSLIFGSAGLGAGVFELVTATVSAALNVTLFDNGARAASLALAQSRAREASLVYRQTLLQALEQVESALVAQQGAKARIDARQRASVSAQAAEAQAQTLYRAGLTGFLDVVDAQRSALANQRQLLQAQADAATAAVVTFEAMGLIAPGQQAPAPAAL